VTGGTAVRFGVLIVIGTANFVNARRRARSSGIIIMNFIAWRLQDFFGIKNAIITPNHDFYVKNHAMCDWCYITINLLLLNNFFDL
jgi:hypothetical protein